MKRMSITWKLLLIAYLIVVHVLAGLFISDALHGRHGLSKTAIDSSTTIAIDSGWHSINQDRRSNPGRGVDSLAGYTQITADTGKLFIPVVGVKRSELQDTYDDARSGGRVHDAIDIMAAGGTPVVAAADGEIAKFFDSRLGGITIYQWSIDKKRIYYYAHLQRRASGIAEGSLVKRGTVIGFVGDTGNAGTGNFHLHFSIIIPSSPDRYWDGTDINPFPILKEGIEVPKH